MNVKLRAEQAEWLIGILKTFNQLGKDIKPHWDMPDNFVAWEHIERAINQCTEKEFPAFNMAWKCKDEFDTPYRLSVKEQDNDIKINLSDFVGDNALGTFSKEQFQEFTDKCVAICDWYKEREC